MSILTPADLRKTYGMNLPATNDVVWQDCIDTAEDQCRRIIDIGRDWKNDEDVYFDYEDARNGLLALGRAPIITVSVALDDGSHTFPTSLASGTDYRIDANAGVVVLYGSRTIFDERDAIRCSITYGWETEDIPEGIRRAVAWTAMYISKMTASNQIGVTQRTNDGGTESIEQAMVPNAVYKTLEYYRTGRIR